ncbi:hypothetical protein ACTI_27990 [Actinoplanes sp. OR16]|uniref:DUF4190 domain-containing protein n=1 Tax=Actinoplanes sp. OR16 TaxID=946334 RepID=UPI000F6E7E17|nr:DUF4190 domain-containing protein [Actinoplanes sp. OR16]BBH66114.1 hypothetical protein ACTI_27990 [Actinoplanes sp. OR16]
MAYPPPAYGPPPGPPAQPQNAFGLTGMILGIVSIPISCCWPVAGVLSIVGLVFSYLGKKKADSGLATNRGIAIAGLATSVAGLVLSIAFLILALTIPSDFDYNVWLRENS